MSIQQTIIGLENNFRNRASVLSHAISRDNVVSDNETSFLMLGTGFDMRSVRVHTRARSERQIASDLVPDLIQNALTEELGDEATINEDVTIGAMYTDDLPIGGQEYSNIFVVVSWGMRVDMPIGRDAQVNVEMYFGWRQDGRNMSIADDWYLNIAVDRVGPLRRSKVREKVTEKLMSPDDSGLNAGQQIRNGLGAIFNQTNVGHWYVVPGSGLHNTQENNIDIKRDASFWIVE